MLKIPVKGCKPPIDGALDITMLERIVMHMSRHAAVDPNHPGSDAPKIAFARCPARPSCVGFRESARRWISDARNSL
jgi:hypothetical protein